MSIDISISTKTDSVQFMYSKYLSKSYIVNRKYQRKLVWCLTEKQAFIDSLRCQYSVPLFLFAEVATEGQERFEIIDGLQRMNAITSFIENEFPIEVEGKYYFFDLDTLADTREAKDTGLLVQKKPKLDRSTCTRIVNYPLSISIIRADQKSIETVFRRINSFGRQLSDQEIRMAGAVGLFPDLVRIISSRIRGDVSSSDKMNLNDMKNISLSDSSLNYGINVHQIYWVKNQIINHGNIRTSRDEEIISHLLAYILLGKDTEPKRSTIDSLYQYENNNTETSVIDDAINRYGFDKLVADFQKTTELFRVICNKANKTLRQLICGNNKIHGMFRSYQVLFLAIFDLYINQAKTKVDIQKLITLLDNIAHSQLNNIGEDSQWTANFRNSKIKAIKGIIQEAFKQDELKDVATENWITELENLLTLSKSEGTQYDFKQTCYDLSKNKFSDNLVLKIVKTLTAEANRPKSIGYVILGVADKKESAEKYKNIFASEYRETPNNSFYITGVESEINRFHKGDSDNYAKKIKAVINSAPITPDVRQRICQNLKFVDYYGHTVIIFKLESNDSPIAYDDNFYIRSGNDCEKVIGASEITALINSFHRVAKPQ